MMIARVVRRYFGGIVLGLVAALAFFQARGAAQLLGAALLGGAGARKSTAPPPAEQAAAKDGLTVLQRNPFDSATGALTSERRALRDAWTSAADFSDPLSWPSCEGVRVSIVTQSSDPSWSLTTVQTSGEPRARLRRVGDDVAGKQVAFIGYNPKQLSPSVWLEGGGAFCQSTLFREQLEPVVLAATSPALDQGGRQVERAVVESTLRDPLSLVRSVRVVPEQLNGKLVGLRLFGIRPGSLLDTLGVKNRDRLETINGFSMASPEQALQAYARLRTASRLNVQLNRSGQPVQLELNIN